LIFKAALIEFCHTLFFDASMLMYISEMVELNHHVAAQTVQYFVDAYEILIDLM